MALLQALLDGLMLGGVYAVISIGLTLVFGVVSIVNFAQAQFLMLGMYVAWFAWRYLGLDPLLGSLLAFAVVFVVGWFMQQWLVRRVLKAPEVAQIFLTVGILIVLENGALIVFGSEFKSVQTPYQNESLEWGGLLINLPYAIAFAAAAVGRAGGLVGAGQDLVGAAACAPPHRTRWPHAWWASTPTASTAWRWAWAWA